LDTLESAPKWHIYRFTRFFTAKQYAQIANLSPPEAVANGFDRLDPHGHVPVSHLLYVWFVLVNTSRFCLFPMGAMFSSIDLGFITSRCSRGQSFSLEVEARRSRLSPMLPDRCQNIGLYAEAKILVSRTG